MEKRQKIYDVAVIGAGPAGMMAAGVAAQNGAQVILIEKNDKPGRKLLLTGKGRCNITNMEPDPGSFLEVFGKNGKFLYTALKIFGIEDTIRFFNQLGLPTKVERGRRVFPVSDKAYDLVRVLLDFLNQTGVKIFSGSAVRLLVKERSSIVKILLPKHKIFAHKYILCTGGLSYPSTGSSGEGFKWASRFGHTIIHPVPALVPLKFRETWVKKLEGLTLKNVQIAIYQGGKKVDERFGEALFTADGISGPIILDMSKNIGKLLRHGRIELFIDLKPALDFRILDARLQRDFSENPNAMFKNSLDELLPKTLIPIVVGLSMIDPSKKANCITKEERRKLVHLLKGLRFSVSDIGGFEKAVVTSGGVSLKEIDPKTMRSKIIDNLYFAGEILDLDGPTGGYNLQVCWSTGYLAGKSAAKK